MLRYFLNSIFFLLFLSSCQEYQEVEFTKISNLRIKGIENGTLVIDGDVQFYNPNKSRLKLKKAEIEVFVKGKKVAVLNSIEKVKIKPRGTFEIPLDARLELNNSGVLGNILDLMRKRDIEMEFKGYIVVSAYLVRKRIEIHETQIVRM